MGGRTMEIREIAVKTLIPYEKNPRKNDEAVKFVANSIKEFGFKVPLVIDSNNIIVAGHTRYKAAQKLKMATVPCIIANDLTPEQIKAFRLADNKVAEFAKWDDNLLAEELNGILDIDMGSFGFSFFDDEESKEAKYSMATNIPQYEIKGECPSISEMLDTERSDGLIQEIKDSGVSEEEKKFLIEAARRHNVFNYRNIAEYYAHASAEMQRLMEKSALVIIDLDDAIANGYTELTETVSKIMGIDNA